jgi:hypothetical protein
MATSMGTSELSGWAGEDWRKGMALWLGMPVPISTSLGAQLSVTTFTSVKLGNATWGQKHTPI